MAAYTVKNTAGATVATISVATTTGASFPIEMIGQGTSTYGQIIATTQYQMLENFANSTPPINPVIGMNWYDNVNNAYMYYDGVQWTPLGSLTTNTSNKFEMLSSATNVNMSAMGVTPLFTNSVAGDLYHTTGMMMKVHGIPTATAPALANLMVQSSEDVLENVSVYLPDEDFHGYYLIQGTTRSIKNGETINLEVTSPASGGSLMVDVILFGFKT